MQYITKAYSTWNWNAIPNTLQKKSSHNLILSKSGEYVIAPELFQKPISLVVKAGISVTIVDEFVATSSSARLVTISSGNSSKVTYKIHSTTNQSIYQCQCLPGKNASVRIEGTFICTGDSVITLEGFLNFKNAEAVFALSAQFKNNSQNLVQLINHHNAQNTTGDMISKTVGYDQSISTLYGMIDIAKKAIETESFLKQDGLIVSKQAEIKSIPNLEISQNDVKASHSSAIGKLDEKALYYLTSRGLLASDATNLLIKGFLKIPTSLTSK